MIAKIALVLFKHAKLSKDESALLLNEALSTVGSLPLHRILTTDDAGRLHVRGNPLDIKEQMLLREQAEAILEELQTQELIQQYNAFNDQESEFDTL